MLRVKTNLCAALDMVFLSAVETGLSTLLPCPVYILIDGIVKRIGVVMSSLGDSIIG